jgi:hypothetical protein
MVSLARIDRIAEISSKIRLLGFQERRAEAAENWPLANRLQAEIRELDDERIAVVRALRFN